MFLHNNDSVESFYFDHMKSKPLRCVPFVPKWVGEYTLSPFCQRN